ncbi:hypothetical protein PGRAT_07230 [Paenibacillus graminis]|uniref:Uncharacterized protein n=1 Tax=Paenibacillus graminis TaxID=189425 RepID=A0A089M526_9BACL|nr:hypothetical protein PGRAT_07230 [Paenibacillus graminis]
MARGYGVIGAKIVLRLEQRRKKNYAFLMPKTVGFFTIRLCLSAALTVAVTVFHTTKVNVFMSKSELIALHTIKKTPIG